MGARGGWLRTGEILIASIDREGTGEGYDLDVASVDAGDLRVADGRVRTQQHLVEEVTVDRAFGEPGTDPQNPVTMALSHETGVVSHVHFDSLSRRPVRRCEVYGTDGTLRLDLLTGELELAGRSGSHAFAPPGGWDPEDMFRDELRHFLACLSGEALPEQDLPSGAEALR